VTKAQRPVGTIVINTVENEHVEVHVEVQSATEALDQRHGTRLRALARETGLVDQMHGETPMDDAEHLAHDRRLVGEEEPKRPWHAQHPLAHRLLGEDLVDEERGALGHAPRAAARAEAAALAAEGDEVLGAAAVTGDAKEAVLESSAGEEVLELARDMPWQGRSLRREMHLKDGIVLLDEAVEKGLLGPMARILGRATFEETVTAPCHPIRSSCRTDQLRAKHELETL